MICSGVNIEAVCMRLQDVKLDLFQALLSQVESGYMWGQAASLQEFAARDGLMTEKVKLR